MNNKFELGPNQKKWLEALKSGEWSWGKNYLAYTDSNDKKWKHCCLGVGCEIFKIEYSIVDDDLFKSFMGNEELSDAFATIVALRSSNGIIRIFDIDERSTFAKLYDIKKAETMFITNINDSSKSGYAPVIWIIENHPEWIFTESR